MFATHSAAAWVVAAGFPLAVFALAVRSLFRT